MVALFSPSSSNGATNGMVINDDQGFERMGYGLKPMDGRYRVSLGLDTGR